MRNPSHFRPKQHTIFSRDLCRAGAISVIRTRDTSERSCPSSHHYGPGAGTREEHDAPSGGNILGWPSSSRKAEGDARGELQRSSRRLGWPVDAKNSTASRRRFAGGTCFLRIGQLAFGPWFFRTRFP